MFIQFNKDLMHVQVVVGVNEKYEPADKVKDIHSKVESLKEKLRKFRAEVVGPELAEIEKLVKEENDKYMPSPEG